MRIRRNYIIILLSGILACLAMLQPDSLYASPTDKTFTVVIDAGHGGHDPGAIGKRGREKNINLSVALKVGRLIKENCPDTKVIFTGGPK